MIFNAHGVYVGVQMSEAYAEILALMGSSETISHQRVLDWMKSPDLRIRGALYALTDTAWDRIRPEINMYEQCNFMADYLLDCIKNNPSSEDYLHSGYEAAWELSDWMKHLLTMENSNETLKGVASRLEHLYRESDADTRDRIVNGTLEHAFEEENLVPFFEYWQQDVDLRDAFHEALEWDRHGTSNKEA